MAATLIGFTSASARAQAPETLRLPALWDAVYTARAGGGFKDNVFLSHASSQAGGFVSAGADVMLLRAATTGPQLNFFASADVNHFFTRQSYDEITAFAQAQAEQQFCGALKISLAAEYFFQDQFIDISALEATVTATNAAVRGHTLTARPGLRWDLPAGFWLAVEAPGTRQWFEQPLDDYWKTGGKFTAGYGYGRKSYVSVGYEPSWRWQDHDPALTATGTVITNTHRERFQLETVLQWRHFWDASSHWRTTAKFGHRQVTENGAGFADYTEWFLSGQIRYRTGPWEITADARGRRYDYDRQAVSASNPALRRREEWDASLRVERDLTPHLRAIASYERGEVWSNDERERYAVNTISGSLQWEF